MHLIFFLIYKSLKLQQQESQMCNKKMPIPLVSHGHVELVLVFVTLGERKDIHKSTQKRNNKFNRMNLVILNQPQITFWAILDKPTACFKLSWLVGCFVESSLWFHKALKQDFQIYLDIDRKGDTEKMYNFEFWCPLISAQDHRIIKICVSTLHNIPIIRGYTQEC